MSPESTTTTSRLSNLRTKPLTPTQERRLVTYLDDQFLQLTRGYKKRMEESTTVPTLHKYIAYARRLLAFILQIPPVDPSTELRTQYMLRLTGDVLNAVIGYGLPPRSAKSNGHGVNKEENNDDDEPKDYSTALRELLDWLDDLDQAWFAVLQSQVWDPDVGEGVDLVLEVESNRSDNGKEENGVVVVEGKMKSTPISQTDVTRLRSLLVTSIANLEEWLSQVGGAPSTMSGDGEEDDVSGMLERIGLLDEFDELFGRTMDFLGGFGGGFVLEPETIVEGDDEEDMNDMVEVEMGGCS